MEKKNMATDEIVGNNTFDNVQNTKHAKTAEPSETIPAKGNPVPFLAVCVDGNLSVHLFEDRDTAKKTYDEIKAKYVKDPSFIENILDNGKKLLFQTTDHEGPSVMLAETKIITKSTIVKIQ